MLFHRLPALPMLSPFMEINHKLCAFPRLRLHLDVAVLFFEDLPGEIQADSHAFFLADFLRPVEPAENLRDFFLPDSDALIFDAHRQIHLILSNRNGDRASRRGIFHRVVQYISYGLFGPFKIKRGAGFSLVGIMNGDTFCLLYTSDAADE